jgi:hypothetical protein
MSAWNALIRPTVLCTVVRFRFPLVLFDSRPVIVMTSREPFGVSYVPRVFSVGPGLSTT